MIRVLIITGHPCCYWSRTNPCGCLPPASLTVSGCRQSSQSLALRGGWAFINGSTENSCISRQGKAKQGKLKQSKGTCGSEELSTAASARVGAWLQVCAVRDNLSVNTSANTHLLILSFQSLCPSLLSALRLLS